MNIVTIIKLGDKLCIPTMKMQLSDYQMSVLQDTFANNPSLSRQKRKELAKQIGWTQDGIYRWFKRKLRKRENQEIASKSECIIYIVYP